MMKLVLVHLDKERKQITFNVVCRALARKSPPAMVMAETVGEMVKKLKDCKVGDVVRLYCIGWGTYDNQLSKIINKGFFVQVKGEDGVISNMVESAICQVFD